MDIKFSVEDKFSSFLNYYLDLMNSKVYFYHKRSPFLNDFVNNSQSIVRKGHPAEIKIF